MTGQEFKRLYMSLGWTAAKAAQELDIARDTLYALHKREEVDKRTEYAMKFLVYINTNPIEAGQLFVRAKLANKED